MEREAPDEFAVTPSSRPLCVPPDITYLPVPIPGAKNPQDIQQNSENVKLLGAEKIKGTLSPGQKALLKMCGAEHQDPKIRYQIDTESHIEKAKGKPLLETLGIRSTKPAGEVINPNEELLKLEEQGVSSNQGVVSAPTR